MWMCNAYRFFNLISCIDMELYTVFLSEYIDEYIDYQYYIYYVGNLICSVIQYNAGVLNWTDNKLHRINVLARSC